MGNKTTETSCLNIAIEKCLKQKGLSKKIGRLLSGNDINRENDEAPDFLRYCPPTDKEEGIVIGIEHFRVDHYAEELKNKKVSSLGCQFERRINDTVQTWKPQINENEEVPEGALDAVGVLISNLLALKLQATYSAFIESFRYALKKHNEAVERYHSVVEQYSQGGKHKLAFLIEVHSDFSQLFFHDSEGIHYRENMVPMFDDVVKELEAIDKRVDYIVMCFGRVFFDNDVEVIAIPTRKVRDQLCKRNIPVYYYAGHDLSLDRFQTPRLDIKTHFNHRREGENIEYKVSLTSREITSEKQFEMVIDAYKYVKELEYRGHNYATTGLVEMVYEVFDDYLSCSRVLDVSTKNLEDLIFFTIRADQERINSRFEQFSSRWGIGDNNV